MALQAAGTWNQIPAEASMIQLMTGQTVYGQKPAMRHIGICRMLSEKRLLRMLRKDRENIRQTITGSCPKMSGRS